MDGDYQAKTFFCGLTNNLDLVIHISPDQFSEFAQRYGDATTEIPADSKVITTVPECISLLIEYMRRGSGGEISFNGEDIPRFIEDCFSSTPSLGGTGMRAAELISLAHSECFVHLPYLDSQVAELLKPIDAGIVHDNVITRTRDAASLTEKETPFSGRRPNYIIQYPEQTSFSVFGETIEIPNGNRIIFTQYSKPERSLPLFPIFFTLFRDCRKPATLLLSGYNAVRDPSILTGRLQETVEYIQAPIGGRTTIVLEMAGFSRSSFFLETIQTLAPYVDFISMNDEELREVTQWLHLTEQTEDMMISAHRLASKYAVRNLIIHTYQYSFCLCDDSTYNLQKISTGLRRANSIAAAVASGKEVSSVPSLLQYGERLTYNHTGEQFCLAHNRSSLGGRRIVCEPARVCDSLVRTVGLGDAFIGSFMLFGT